jgi:hypothetical protein
MNAESQSTPTLERRRRAVRSLISFTRQTPLAAGRYERKLLSRFAEGELTIDEVLHRLEARTARPTEQPC